LIALFNKIINKQTVTNRTASAITLLPLVHIILQNYRMAQTPYFDIALDKQDNLYANFSFRSIGRIACAIGSSWASFMGSSFMLNKVAP